MKNIKFIYFDVGGVICLDFSNTNKWEQLKKDLGVNSINNDDFEKIWQEQRDKICVDCDVDTLIPKFREKAKISPPTKYSLLEDFVNRFEKNPSIYNLVEKAKEKYGIGLLTNMYPRMLSLMQEKELVPNFGWDVIIDSSKVKAQKPDKEIFEAAENLSGFSSKELFFIDNTKRHVDAAKERGWSGFMYDNLNPEKSTQELLEILELN